MTGPAGPCDLWEGFTNHNGYGRVYVAGRHWLVHRLVWTVHRGPIPDGMTVDHLCFEPRCCNIDHLRLLSRSDNARFRRNTFNLSCGKGHPWTPANTGYRNTGRNKDGTRKRYCRACAAIYGQRVRQRALAETGSAAPAFLFACLVMLLAGLVVGYLAVSPLFTLDIPR